MKILGLHRDHLFIHWAAIELKGKKVELRSLQALSPEDVKRLYTQVPKDLAAVGLHALVRHLEFKVSSLRKIEKGLSFQVESLTSLPLDQIAFTSQITPTKSGADASIFLAAKQTLREELKEWELLGVVPDVATATAQGLLKFMHYRCTGFSQGFLIHLGSKETTCVWVAEGVVKKAFVIDEGVDSFLAALWEDRKKALFQNEVQSVAKQIDLLLLKENLNPLLSAQLEQFAKKLGSVLTSFSKATSSLNLLFTGRMDAFANLGPFLHKRLPEIQLYHPPLPLNQEELKGAIAIGLAIEASSSSNKRVQLLTGEFIPLRQWQKAGRTSLVLLACSLFSSLGLGLLGFQHLEEKKELFAQELTQVVSQIDEPLSAMLFQEGIEAGVAEAMNAVQKYNREALFLLQAPTVNEVLAWISNHPMFTALAQSGDPLDLVQLNYQLVSWPKVGHARDPYQAKIEMQFRLKQSMSARKLHEELLRGSEMVDSAQEINWEALSDGYQATFYLKNRPPHVL